MQAFFQSSFLQALGYAIFNSLWQVALLWLAALLVNSIGKFSSSKKYFVAVVAQFAGFAWFIFTLHFYYVRCSEAMATSTVTASDGLYIYEPSVNSFSSALMYGIIKTEQLLPYLSVAYLSMLLFLSVRLTRAYLYTKQIRTTGLQKPSVDLRLFVKQTAAALGIKHSVSVYFSELVKSPLTIGFAKPLILVPVASVNHLTTDQLEAILLHELAHIRRADYLINIIQSVIETTLFFNPFVLLLGKFINKERENSCDDWVLQFQYQPAMYAEALLRIACIQSQPVFTMNATGNNKGELLPRVKRMLNQQEKNYNYRNQLFALLLITVMLTTVAWFNPAVNKKTFTNNNNTSAKKIMVEPFTANVDNPLFNPIYFLAKPIQEKIDRAIDEAGDKVSNAVEFDGNVKELVSKVSPIALESLKNISINFPEIKEQTAQALKGIDLSKMKTSFADSSMAIADMLQKEIDKIDWSSVQSDIEKAQDDLKKEIADVKLNAEISTTVNDAVKQITLQLPQLKSKKPFNIEALINHAFDNNKKDVSQKIDQATKELQLRIKGSEKNKKQKHSEAIIEADAWNNDEDNNAPEAYSIVAPKYNFNYNANISPVYAPVTLTTNTDFNFPVADSLRSLDSAIIVVQHNPENDKSHTKHITVQIVGNNGVTKNYTFTVEVYQ